MAAHTISAKSTQTDTPSATALAHQLYYYSSLAVVGWDRGWRITNKRGQRRFFYSRITFGKNRR